LAKLDDSAVMDFPAGRLAMTTDSYVVDPIFFPGGDIGMLAINGTVNDLAAQGAQPLFLSVAFILEEGFELADLERILISMTSASQEANVTIVAGDTKVVPKGKGDKIYINTTGVGLVQAGLRY
jgi:hydrogenase expression/formation protein HypE